MNEFVGIYERQVLPGFGFIACALHSLGTSPSFSFDPSIEITKRIKNLKEN